MQKQLFKETQTHFSHKPTSKDKIADGNVRAMTSAIQTHGMFTDCQENAGLWNFLGKLQATAEQDHDLLNINEIGMSMYDLYIESRLLRKPVTNTTKKRKQLCTFSVSKSQRKRMSDIDREKKLNQRYLKRQLTWLTQHGFHEANHELLYGQISTIPRALVDSNGLPFKSNKCITTQCLQKRYALANVITDTPPQLAPNCVILEGMFMIQTPAI